MFGINKNGTKHKIGIVMPSFFPSSRVTYKNGSVSGALDGVTADIHGIKDSVNIAAGNLDTYTTPGVYCVFLTSAASPLTEGAVCVLEVFAVRFTGNFSIGYVQRLTNVYPTDSKVVQRSYYGASGGWGAWREV